MDHSWRHPPPPPHPPVVGAPLHSTICPVCSVPHFPFCPPPFPQNHHIHHHHHHHQYPPPPHADQFYSRPPPPPPLALPLPLAPQPPVPAAAAPYDPFVDHKSMPVINPHGPPADAQFHRNGGSSGFDRDPYGNMPPGHDYNNLGGKRLNFDDSGNLGPKRMRFDEPRLSSDPYMNDNERRLRLIRDHGGVTNQEVDRIFDGTADMGFKPSISFDATNFQSPKYGDVDRKGKLDNSLGMHKHGGEQLGRDNWISSRNVDQGDNSFRQNNLYGYSGHPTNSYNRQSQETMGYNRQGASVGSGVFNEHRSGITRENQNFHNQFSQQHSMQHHMEPKVSQHSPPFMNNQGGSLPYRSGMNIGLGQDSQVFNDQPPLPTSPPPPLPVEPLGKRLSEPLVPLLPSASSAVAPSLYRSLPEVSPLPSLYYADKNRQHASTGFGSVVCATSAMTI